VPLLTLSVFHTWNTPWKERNLPKSYLFMQGSREVMNKSRVCRKCGRWRAIPFMRKTLRLLLLFIKLEAWFTMYGKYSSPQQIIIFSWCWWWCASRENSKLINYPLSPRSLTPQSNVSVVLELCALDIYLSEGSLTVIIIVSLFGSSIFLSDNLWLERWRAQKTLLFILGSKFSDRRYNRWPVEYMKQPAWLHAPPWG